MDAEEIRQLFDEAAQGIVPADLRAQGWRYIDPPTRFSIEMWDYFLSLLGEGEYKILVMTHGKTKDGFEYKRGQFIVSPKAQENMKNARANHASVHG
jgi:hypothetical protein